MKALCLNVLKKIERYNNYNIGKFSKSLFSKSREQEIKGKLGKRFYNVYHY